MHFKQMCCAVLAVTLILGSFHSEAADSEKTHVGGCVLLSPLGRVPDNLNQIGEIVPTDDYRPFTKKLTVYGITLMGRDDVTNQFMRNVAKTVTEMFPRRDGVDTKMQEEVIESMYRYRVAIPLFKGEPGFEVEEDWASYRDLKQRNSMCDIIMEGEPGRQIMEVVEHILHHVTDVGFHYAWPKEWAITGGSRIHKLMLDAVEKGYYDDTSYDGIDDKEARLRVKIQEFAYCIITTAWDQQVPYGGGGDEWTRGGTIATSDDLKTQFPEAWQLYEETVAKVMVAPSNSLLEELFGNERRR